MAVPGALGRAVQHVTVGTVLGMRERADRDAEVDLHELDLQYQLEVSGDAGTIVAWAEIPVEFEEWEFHYAPANRESDLVWPQMTYGAHIDRGGPVGIFAHVSAWTQREETGAIVGAIVQVGAIADALKPFGGTVHVTFQGYGMSRDDLADSPDLEAGTE